MEELKTRIADLKLLAKTFKNNIDEFYLYSQEIKRLEKLLAIKVEEFKCLTSINQFNIGY